MQDKKVQDVYTSYFRFNNKRTLSTELPSELLIYEANGCSIFVDKTRRYDNQIVIRDAFKAAELERHLQLFHNKCSPEISIEPQANTPELQTWLSSRGFAPVYEHEFLELQASNYVASEKAQGLMTIERWGQSNVDDFLALLKTSGVVFTTDVWEKKRSFYCTDTFRCYVATMNGVPCAWATSFIENKYAIFANAYTQEEHRSKGCQTALLRARTEDAMSLGIEMLLTDVMPGSTSSNNCKSVGFCSIGIRSVWEKG